MTEQPNATCQVICYAESLRFKELTDELLTAGRGACYRNVFFLEIDQGSCAIFPFAVAVYWNMAQEQIERLSQEIQSFCTNPLTQIEVELFYYRSHCERTRFFHDRIELANSEPLTLLALSHALAQSTKLSVFEAQAQKTIEATASIPRSLAQKGTTSMSRRQTARMRGQLFITKNEIILKYELLDTPEFFWEYPELQAIYEIGASYLEIKPRTEILSLKLETIHEMFEMLADELRHQHSSTLEWIIIWLIAVEIVMFLVHDVFMVA